MPSYFDLNQGAFYRTPTWHQLEQEIYTEWPGSWAELRTKARLIWEPETDPVYAHYSGYGSFDKEYYSNYRPIKGWQMIKRSDDGAVLSIQTDQYRVIDHDAMGRIIETVLGLDWGAQVQYEGLFTLFGGKLVIAVIRDTEVEHVTGDPSPTLTYTVVVTRHDGQGGMKIVRTKIRVVCWNTWSAAEHAGIENKTSFVIRHTENWDDRVAEVRDHLAAAKQADGWYMEVMDQMAASTAGGRKRETFLKKLLPVGDDMGERQRQNRLSERDQIRTILEGPTCEGISGTVYGLVQAAGEWSDHYRRSRTTETYVNRTLLTKDPTKIRAFKLGKSLAKIK